MTPVGNLLALHRDRTLCRPLLSHLEKNLTVAVEMAQSVRCFVLQREDLSLNSRIHRQKLDMWSLEAWSLKGRDK